MQGCHFGRNLTLFDVKFFDMRCYILETRWYLNSAIHWRLNAAIWILTQLFWSSIHHGIVSLLMLFLVGPTV